MNREEWLKSLKIGDKVANEEYYGLDKEKTYKFYEIKSITKKGNIRLTNGVLLNENGYYHKYERWSSFTYNIEPVTDKIIKYEEDRNKYNSLKYEVGNLIDKFVHLKFNYEELKDLKNILEKGKKK